MRALYLHNLALLLWLSLDEVRLGYVQFVHELFISSDVRISNQNQITSVDI